MTYFVFLQPWPNFLHLKYLFSTFVFMPGLPSPSQPNWKRETCSQKWPVRRWHSPVAGLLKLCIFYQFWEKYFNQTILNTSLQSFLSVPILHKHQDKTRILKRRRTSSIFYEPEKDQVQGKSLKMYWQEYFIQHTFDRISISRKIDAQPILLPKKVKQICISSAWK